MPATEFDAIPPPNTKPTEDDIPQNKSPKLPVGAQKQEAQKNKEKEKSATVGMYQKYHNYFCSVREIANKKNVFFLTEVSS